MNLFKGFGNGVGAYAKALNLIFSNGLWWYFLFPILLNVFIFVGSFYGVGSVAEVVEHWLVEIANLDEETFWGAIYLKSIMGGFVWVLFKFVFFILFATVGGYLIIMLMSPVFAILSEKTEEILTGNKYPFNADQLMRDVVRGVLVALRNMFIELGFMLVFFVIGFIPIVGQFAAIGLFVLSSYFYGFAFIDYTSERRRLTISQSVTFVRAHKGMVIGNGFVFALAMLIPFCGITIAGFVAIVSVVAATISTHKIVDLSDNIYVNHKKID